MNRRALFGFLILNVIVTFVTVIGIISFWTRFGPQPTRQAVSPLQVVITATPDPRGTQVVYITVVVTAAPNNSAKTPGNSASSNGTSVASVFTTTPGAETSDDGNTIPTLDPSMLPLSLGTSETLTASDITLTPVANPTDSNGCQTYTIKQGDTAGRIAQDFGVTLGALMAANDLSESDLTRLRIGQSLTIPLNGCGLPTETPTFTPTKFVLPTVPPTSTIAPTASDAQVAIVQVLSPGDITAEGIELHNISGGVIPMQDWTITDNTDQTFKFPKYNLFPGGRVTIYTRAGTNTPIVLYWGQPSAVWGEPNQVVKLTDSKGAVQAIYPVSGPAATANAAGLGNTVSTPTGTPE
jgi:LysM repeat protein